MDRRDFLKGAAGAAGLTSLSGCAGFLDGEDDEPRDWEYDDESQDDRVLNARRLEFTGNKETLGHVADEDNNPGDYDGTPVEYEITRTESDWQNLSNDLDAAKERLEDGSYRRGVESYDDLRQEVETALAEAPEDKAPERTVIETVGHISDHQVVLPEASEALADELLDSDLRMWQTGGTHPALNGSFTHRVFVASYSEEGEDRRDYVDIGIPSQAVEVENPENQDMVPNGLDVRSPEDSIYNQPEELEYLAGFEFDKMMSAAQEGLLDQEEEFNTDHPMQSVARGGVLGQFSDMADGPVNDFGGPDNPYYPVITPEFGRSVEEAFYDEDWTHENVEKMRNIGRAMNKVIEEESGNVYIGVDGTLDEPEIYRLSSADSARAAWDAAMEQDRLDLENIEDLREN